MNEFEDDLALAETVDSLQRQLAFQEQMGGNVTLRNLGALNLHLTCMWIASVKAWVFENVILLPISTSKDNLSKTSD